MAKVLSIKGITLVRPVAKVIEDEADRNPEFSRRIQAALAEAREKATRRRRSPPVLDPMDIARSGGKDALRARLAELDIERLKDIVSQYALDSRAMRWKTRERILDTIVEVAHYRARKGEVFLRWKPPARRAV